MSTEFKPGDKVRLTSKFLRNTGQYTGDEPRKIWTIRAVEPKTHGLQLVTVDELKGDLSYYTAEELEADPELKWRRINAGNLMLASKPDYS